MEVLLLNQQCPAPPIQLAPGTTGKKISADQQGTESSSGLSVYARCCGVYGERGQALAPLDEDIIFIKA